MRRLWMLGCVVLAGCKPAPVATRYEAWVPPVGQLIPPGCTKDADGKRYRLEGKLDFGSSIELDEKHDVDLELKPMNDARGVQLKVREGRDIDELSSQMKDVKQKAYLLREGRLPPDALRIHTTSGTVPGGSRVTVVFEVETITHFQTHEVTACVLRFVEASSP